ncbi:MAG: aminoacyl-tRNA hydrolase [Planctomycetales bacterium]|nr:aminoacyl-tRNA hydrolase [Planctomycetales bacterium]
MEDLVINSRLIIPSQYLEASYSRSSGPGGQHVNKLNTQVHLFLDIAKCPCFSEAQKNKLRTALKARIDKQGILQVSCQQYRSQVANRNTAMERMADLIRAALKPVRMRKKTSVPKRAVEKRLQDKSARAKIKQARSGRDKGGE